MKQIIAALVATSLVAGASYVMAGTCGADKATTTSASCGADKGSTSTCSGKDLVTLASGAENFKTLVAAVKAAGLDQTLAGKGPYTIFAPTDAAFAKLPPGTVESLLKPENKEKLAAILKYHVVPGKVLAADVKSGQVATVQGQKVTVKASDAGVKIDNANVIKTDLLANNGVIHVIDAVILPQS